MDDDDDLFSEDDESEAEVEEIAEHLRPTPLVSLKEQICKLQVFDGCTDLLLDVLVPLFKERLLKPGESIELVDNGPLYVVRQGAMSIRVAGGPEVICGPGMVLNMVGMLGIQADAEPFRPKDRNKAAPPKNPNKGLSDKTRAALQDPDLKNDLNRIEGLRAGSYDSYMPNAAPQSVFAERKRTVGSTAARTATSSVDDATCFWSLCPSQMIHQEHTKKITDWLPMQVQGAAKLAIPTYEGGKEIDYERGGALIATLYRADVEDIKYKEGRSNPLMRIELDCYSNNWETVADKWRTIMSRCSRNIFGLPPEVSWAMAEIAEPGSFDVGECVVDEGDAEAQCEDLIIIDEGEAVVEKRVGTVGFAATKKVQVGRLGPGAIIGDICLIGANVPRPAQVRAKTMVETLKLPAQKVKALMQQWPGLVGCMKARMHEASHALMIRLPVRTEGLQALRLFQGCESAFLSEIAASGERQVSYCGSVIKREGSEDGTLFALEYGECNVEIHGQGKVATVPVGNCFGDRTLLGAPRANATIRVASPFCICLAVTQHTLNSVLFRHPSEKRRFDALSKLPAGRTMGKQVGHIEVFSASSQPFIEMICRTIEMKSYMPGQTIVVQGSQDAAQMFVLRGGQVTIEHDGARIQDLASGATFGELSMLGSVRRRKVTVRALTFCFMMEIGRDAFLQAIEAFPQERNQFQKHAMRGMEELAQRWSVLPGAPEKFLYLLNLYAERRTCQEEDSLEDAETRECAILVLQGEATLFDKYGNHVKDLAPGDIWNEEALVDVSTEATRTMILRPKKVCEVQIVSKEKWEVANAEFDDKMRYTLRGHIYRSLARKRCRLELGMELEDAKVIRMAAVCKSMSTQCAEACCALLEPTVVQAGETIIEGLAEGGRLCILLAGEAEMIGPNWTLPVSKGEAFGEAELLGLSNSYRFTVTAKTLCFALFLRPHDFNKTLLDFPDDLAFFKPIAQEAKKHPGEDGRTGERLDEKMLRYMGEDVDPEYVRALSKQAVHVFVEPGGTLINMGDLCNFGQSDLFVILNGGGTADVEGELRVKFAELHPGDVCGEGGALGLGCAEEGGGQRACTVRSAGPGLLHVVAIKGQGLEGIFSDFYPQRERMEEIFENRQDERKDFAKKRRAWLQDTVVPALGATPLLAGCPSALLRTIAAPLTETKYDLGDMITVSGEPSTSMLVFLEGEANVFTRAGDAVGNLQAGAAFGEVCALGLFGTATADIRAVTKCKVLRVTAEAMRRALEQPEHAAAAKAFQRLVSSRTYQVDKGLPLGALSIGVLEDDICCRIIALQAEKMPLDVGEYWNPLPDDDACGPHIGVFLEGKAFFESATSGRHITRATEGIVFEEGLLHESDARLVAKTKCEGYRIKLTDFKLALANCPEVHKAWYARFLMLKAETRDNMIMQLNSVKGCVEGLAEHECDAEIKLWRGRRQRASTRATRMKTDKLDLPDLAVALCVPSSVALGSRMGSTYTSVMTRSSMMSRTTQNTSVMSSSTMGSSKGIGMKKRFGNSVMVQSSSTPDFRRTAASTSGFSSKSGKPSSAGTVSLPRL